MVNGRGPISAAVRDDAGKCERAEGGHRWLRGSSMRRREFLSLAASAGAASAFGPWVVHAQPVAGVPRIAILSIPVPTSTVDNVAGGLADYGYVEGRNIVTQRFTAPTTPEVPAYAAQAVASQPAAILCLGTPPTREAMRATATIPIVMLAVNDPLGNGFIASYAHPGGNVTGNTGTASDVIGKQLALLKELVPGLRRLAVVCLGPDPSAARVIGELAPPHERSTWSRYSSISLRPRILLPSSFGSLPPV